MADYYEELGVGREASQEEIVAAGRKAQKAHHPDLGGDPEKFRSVTRALTVLRDPQSRDHYDRTGQDAPPSPESEEAMALDMIAQVMAQSIQGDIPLGQIDVIAKTRVVIEGQIKANHNAIRENNRQIERCEEYLRRLKVKDDRAMIRRIARGRITELQGGTAKAESFISVCNKALEFLKEYSWEKDEEPAAPTYTQARSPYNILGLL